MQLSNLIAKSDVTLVSGDTTQPFTGISCDSRRISSGGLFAALPGTDRDGHDYIQAALEAGASAILCRDDIKLPDTVAHLTAPDLRSAYAQSCALFWPKRGQMHVAVTGTNGKTSTVEYLRQIWQRLNWSAASLGTLGARSVQENAPGQLAGFETGGLTTPPSEMLFSTINELAKGGMTHLALEASSHGIAQGRLVGLPIHVAIFTNLSQDHLDYHDTMDSYFAAKTQLFDNYLMPAGYAVINIDDQWGEALANKLEGRSVVIVRVGRCEKADVRILNIQTSGPFLQINLDVFGTKQIYQVALSGMFQAENAILAATAAHVAGLPIQDAFGALPSLTPTPGRMQPVHGHPDKARIVIDYAHTPDALETALTALRAETENSLYVVFGCGGDRDKSKRPMMGAAAAKLADHVIITDDNPRTEAASDIRKDILKACPDADEIAQRDKAIIAAIGMLKAGDSLMIAGKGHETVQQIGTETLPFDDAAVARMALRQMEGSDA